MKRHDAVHHNGTPETLAAVREKYWIVPGHVVMKKIIRRCFVCRWYNGKPFPSPIVPDLPAERVSKAPPFSTMGIDFAGPLYMRGTNTKESDCNVYICLFTCSSTRELHLELTKKLSAMSFLLAFRQFCGRRGFNRSNKRERWSYMICKDPVDEEGSKCVFEMTNSPSGAT